MITQLSIIDFQVHKTLSIDFDPGVTVIVGPSDRGKSAIIRALCWITANRPSGDAFIRHGARKTEVKLTVDGKTIIRTKGPAAAGNTYHLDGSKLEAFGSDAPPAVAALLNTREVNFQGQHDSPFWFSETAGEVSRQLNQIINLGAIDSCLLHINALIRDCSSKQGVTQERLENALSERARLAKVRDADLDLKGVEALGLKAAVAAVAATRLNVLLSAARKHAQAAQRPVAFCVAAKVIIELGGRSAAATERLNKLDYLIYQARQSAKAAAIRAPSVKELEELAERARKTNTDLAGLLATVAEANRLSAIVRRAGAEVIALQAMLTNAIGKVCPLCQRKM